MFEYKSYNLGQHPSKLVIFLHGYNGSLEDHQYAVDWLKEKLESAVLITPKAPESCDKNPEKFQWFGMIKYDPERRRSMSETSVEDIFQIYNAAENDIDKQAQNLNQFIDMQQKKLQIDNKNSFLIGFSQGAMLTLYTSLTRSEPLGGAFILSGLVAGENLLRQKIVSRPPLYLFHGENDMKVQYKTLPASIDWLKKKHISTEFRTYKGVGHRITEEEIDFIAQKINL